MSKNDLYKLRKTELLQIIYEQEKQISNLKNENTDLKDKLENRIIELKEAGSIAEAALKINKIFENAQKAADEYLSNVKKLSNSKEVTNDKNQESIIENINTKNKTKTKMKTKTQIETGCLELISLNRGLINTRISLFKKIKNFLLQILDETNRLRLKLKIKLLSVFNNIKKWGKIKELKEKFSLLFSFKNQKIRLDDYNLSLANIKKELKKQKNKDSKLNFAKSSTYYIIIIIAITIIIVTKIFNVIQISGNSMEPSLYSGDLLVSTEIFGYQKGDIIAFYYNNSVLIKRIIATEGDTVYIDDEGNVFVNSEKQEENYVKELSYGNCDITFPYKVPDKEFFVLGDNRESSIDSRNKSIGSISSDKILGKIIINIKHLKFY